MNAARSSLVALAAWLCAGCTQCDSPTAKPGAPSASASAGPVPPPSASAAVADSGTAEQLAKIESRKVPAGNASNLTWTVEFELLRVEGDENLDWLSAVEHCEKNDKSLCLESQWLRACELDPAIGRLETWTLTADYPGAAVRGGEKGCKGRAFHKVGTRSAKRVGLCCDRAIAITSLEETDELRTTTTSRVLQVEAALHDGRHEALAATFAEDVSLDGTESGRETLRGSLAEERKQDEKRRVFFDHCNTKMSEDVPPLLIADCGRILHTNGATSGSKLRLAFRGADGPVQYFGAPKNMKKKEKKERVGSFLSSE